MSPCSSSPASSSCLRQQRRLLLWEASSLPSASSLPGLSLPLSSSPQQASSRRASSRLLVPFRESLIARSLEEEEDIFFWKVAFCGKSWVGMVYRNRMWLCDWLLRFYTDRRRGVFGALDWVRKS